MSLSQAIAELVANPPVQQGYLCKINRIVSDLSADDAKALESVVDMKEISASAIARLLVDFGYDVKPRSISKHRKRGQVDGCRCVKK